LASSFGWLPYRAVTIRIEGSKILEILWDAEHRILINRWLGFATVTERTEGLSKGLEHLKLRNGHRWLADLRLAHVIARDAQQWFFEVWIPSALKEGLQHMAILPPNGAVGQFSFPNIVAHLGELGVHVKVFSTLEEAVSWLAATPEAMK
jgi:hypothetical protein